MDVFEAIRTLRAVREYTDQPVPADVVRRVVDAAHLTASSMNAQPWGFLVIDDPDTLKKIAAINTHGPYVAQAPLAIVVAVEKASPFGYSDASRAIQDMMLTAWEAGVGSNWTGFGHLEGLNPLLGIPDDYEVVAVVPFGYPTQPGGSGKKKRKPLGEVAFHGAWGAPFA